MTHKIFTDRSRTETFQHCKRERFLRYHQSGTGIEPQRKPLPLAVGGSVHVGLAHLLLAGQKLVDDANGDVDLAFTQRGWLRDIENTAVATALADFTQYTSIGLELDSGELAARMPQTQAQAGAQVVAINSFEAQLKAQADDLGVPWPAQATAPHDAGEFDRYLAQEQAALVEALVRAWARRKLRALLEQFEVLEVEREGEWLLAEWQQHPSDPDLQEYPDAWRELWFMSRPDALLRERASNQLYILSFKTAATWDVRKERDALRDMQGLSEGVEVERRLAQWWQQIGALKTSDTDYEAWAWGKESPSRAMFDFLAKQETPPRILGIRYEYLLKGYRDEDRQLTERLGHTAYTQRSHLIRQYVARSVPQRGQAEYRVGDVCWSWEYHREDGSSSKLAWQNWKAQPVWEEPGGVKAWIDRLDASELAMSAWDATVGLEPRPLGWKSQAQALGFTAGHPLDAALPPALTVYRNDDELRDWVEQVEAQERAVAETVASVESAGDEGERRHLLNAHFSQTRRACSYPTECPYVKICFGGDSIRHDPLGSGLFKKREPHHPQERAVETSTGVSQLPSE